MSCEKLTRKPLSHAKGNVSGPIILMAVKGRARRVTTADCFAAYMTNHRSLKQYAKDRIASFNEAMRLHMLAEANDAWREWLKDHPKHKPSTVAR